MKDILFTALTLFVIITFASRNATTGVKQPIQNRSKMRGAGIPYNIANAKGNKPLKNRTKFYETVVGNKSVVSSIPRGYKSAQRIKDKTRKIRARVNLRQEDEVTLRPTSDLDSKNFTTATPEAPQEETTEIQLEVDKCASTEKPMVTVSKVKSTKSGETKQGSEIVEPAYFHDGSQDWMFPHDYSIPHYEMPINSWYVHEYPGYSSHHEWEEPTHNQWNYWDYSAMFNEEIPYGCDRFGCGGSQTSGKRKAKKPCKDGSVKSTTLTTTTTTTPPTPTTTTTTTTNPETSTSPITTTDSTWTSIEELLMEHKSMMKQSEDNPLKRDRLTRIFNETIKPIESILLYVINGELS